MLKSPDVIRNSCSIGSNSMECLKLLSESELKFLTDQMVDVYYQKGEMICKQGTFASHVMIIQEGLVKSFLEWNGENLILQIFAPVNIIGLSTLFEGNTVFQHSVQAYIDSKVSLIEISAFKQVMNSNAQFSARMVSLLAEQSAIINGRFYCLTKKQTYGRLADVIICLANRIYKTQKFPLHLSWKDFAELSGMSIESIARIMTKFKGDGLIEINSDFVEILDYEKLNMISQKG
ncbi:MAG TPA: Crp/Fnr family transcriptional regulator [Bacteroidales bacterium]|nr:Crp/Fnr family transcriptional regulator [Bacteroidales bacterium]HQQ13005.1 Crp/Fnr family transcriptional regulator [Bacteroidales bacterium]